MVNIIIIHGTGGCPEGNWFPWLKAELERLGHKVLVPSFPTPERQSLDSWLAAFEPYLKLIDEQTILIGHSIGPAFILNLLERINVRVKASFFVAGFTGPLGLPDFDPLNKTIADCDFDWNRIKAHCMQFYIVNSEDDPYVPLDKGRELSQLLGSPLLVVRGGHLNEESGFKSFPFLLALIKNEFES